MARRKVKNGEREEPLRTMSYQTSSKRWPPFWLLIGARKLVFFWHQSEARTVATVWNWSGKTLSPGALLAVLYFSSFPIHLSARLDFPSPPLSAPGSPRMEFIRLISLINSYLAFPFFFFSMTTFLELGVHLITLTLHEKRKQPNQNKLAMQITF